MRFPFITAASFKQDGTLAVMPYLPIHLSYKGSIVKTYGMLDTGAQVNVLPFSVGLNLGAIWENQTVSMQLGGNLASTEARGLLIEGIFDGCPPVRLAFAWTKTDNVPLLLGHTNFFDEFDVLFSRSSLFFDVLPKGRFK